MCAGDGEPADGSAPAAWARGVIQDFVHQHRFGGLYSYDRPAWWIQAFDVIHRTMLDVDAYEAEKLAQDGGKR